MFTALLTEQVLNQLVLPLISALLLSALTAASLMLRTKFKVGISEKQTAMLHGVLYRAIQSIIAAKLSGQTPRSAVEIIKNLKFDSIAEEAAHRVQRTNPDLFKKTKATLPALAGVAVGKIPEAAAEAAHFSPLIPNDDSGQPLML